MKQVVILSERDKEKNENVPIGKVEVFYPLLEDFGIEAEVKEKDEKGFPVYADERLDWLYNAVTSKVEAQARSKTSNGKTKPGMTIPTCFTELVAIGERGGEALKIKAEFKRAYSGYLAKAGKSEKVIGALTALVINPETLLTVDEKYAAATKAHMVTFITGMSDLEKARFENHIGKIQDSLNGREEGMDLS